MALSVEQRNTVEETLKRALRKKFENYNPEPAAMPFHTRLLGKDRLALYSFIHSLSTNFGTSIFEPVAITLASAKFREAKSQVVSGNYIAEPAQTVIQQIMNGLTTAETSPDKLIEIEQIRAACFGNPMRLKVKPTRVDVWLEKHDGTLYLFDIKTAKPNAGGFKEFKRTLLEWVATVLTEQPDRNVHTLVAIPYNPYAPEPYNRWTMRGMLDLGEELKVAEEFWDFLGGQGAFDDLLGCFERVGLDMRREIDTYFSRFQL
jgi:hypothetical protein